MVFLQVVIDFVVTLIYVIWGICRRICMLPRRAMGPAATAALIGTGIAAFCLLMSGLLFSAGIAYNNPVMLYVGFSMVAICTLIAKASVQFFEKLAHILVVLLGFVFHRDDDRDESHPANIQDYRHPVHIDFGVQKILTDIGMCMIMCSVFALDGREVGLTLNIIGWVSVASLVTLMIISGAKITIRRKVMGGLTALFVITYVIFQISPATKEFVAATTEHMQVGQRRVADVIRPNMPLAEVKIHQDTEQVVLNSELRRYIAEVKKFQDAAADHTPTPAEIEADQKAMANVTTLREAIKLRNPESSTAVAYTWLTSYALIPLLILVAGTFIVMMIIKALPKGGAQPLANTPTGSGSTGERVHDNPAPAHTTHTEHGSGHGFPWKGAGITVAVIAALGLLVWIGLRVGSQSVQASTASLTSLVVTSAPAVNTANLEDFRVLKDGSGDGEWEFQLDARKPWQALPISVSDGDEVEFSASGQVCGGPNVGCAGPNGQTNFARTSRTNPEEFPVGDAYLQALIGQIGSDKFQVGDHKVYLVSNGSGNQSIELMDNYRLPYIAYATGGFRVKVIIRKK